MNNLFWSDPSPLILSELPLNHLDVVIGGVRLLLGDFQLSLDFSARFTGILGSLGGLVVQDTSLGFHFLELAVENDKSYESDEETRSGDNYHPPVSIAKPFFAVLWLAI